MPSCSVTLLTCTRNGGRTIEKCLRHSLDEIRAAGPTAELVVVDNGSSDHTPATVESFHRSHGDCVRLFHVAKPGKQNAIEAGVRAAHGEIVAFIDDDNYVEPGYLRHVVDFFRDYPDAAVVGSSNRLDDSVVAPDWFEWATGQFACTRPTIADAVKRDEKGREVGETGFIPGAGMAFRKQLLLEALDAGYRFFTDTERRAGIAGEDMELCFLLRSMGYRLGFDPRMKIRHDLAESRLNLASFWRMCEMIGAGSLGIDPFIYTSKRDPASVPFNWGWQWRILSKLRRLASGGIDSSERSAAELSFRKRCARHQDWGAVRYLLRSRSRYNDHVRQVASGSWTRLRVR